MHEQQRSARTSAHSRSATGTSSPSRSRSCIFLIAAVAETNRAPFDLPEAETELVSGFHTEYSAFRFSFYFLGEYISMIVISLFASTLFLGGTDGPGSDQLGLGILWLLLKTILFLFFYIWLRAHTAAIPL